MWNLLRNIIITVIGNIIPWQALAWQDLYEKNIVQRNK